jgi:hypothetical protein
MDRIKLTTPPFKGSQGHWLTTQLFYERWIDLKDSEQTFEPLFSLTGKEGFIDARVTFVTLEDPTGYKWAMKYLGSWKHYEKLMATSWFPPYVEVWVQEIKVKLRSDAIAAIRRIAGSKEQGALAAAKYLANLEYDSKRGRPSKAEVKGELRRQAAILTQEDDDAQRIGLTKDYN